MSTVRADNLSNVAGSTSRATADVLNGAARAWVSYDAVTPAVRTSFNVSSMTRISTGDFRMNFTNALANANYACLVGLSVQGLALGGFGYARDDVEARTTTSIRVQIAGDNGTSLNSGNTSWLAIGIFGT